ncbi:MAG: hypothetical protein ACLGG8_04740 [Gammaproteobacteria bacterium]
MEHPVLRLGLLGFSDSAFERLRRWTERDATGWPVWRLGDPHLADAWLIDGSAVEVVDRDALLIAHPLNSAVRLTLNRAEVDRPLAFALPLPQGFASAEAFNGNDEASLRQRLQRFEAWLRPLRSQFVLGEQLVARLAGYQGDVVHVMHDGQLLAVIDFPRWRCGMLIPARPVDLAAAEWVRRPALANDIPSTFLKLRLHQVMWTYAVRTRRDILPARYREQIIHLRRVPQLPPRWFDPVHLLIMQELSSQPGTLRALQERTGLDEALLASRMAALYYGAALTTDADSARRAEPAMRRSVLSLCLGAGDRDRETAVREASQSDLMMPSSILREAAHSPLRAISEPRHNGAGPRRPDSG